MSTHAAMLLAMLLPAAGALGVLLTGARPNGREAVSLITGGIVFLTVANLYSGFDAGAMTTLVLAEPLPGISLAFRAEPLGVLFALIAATLWPVTTLYSIGYMRAHGEQHQTRFYAYFAIAIAAVMGIAFAANLYTLFLFYEALTLSTYPLVTHSGTDAARAGGRTYLGLLLGSSIGLQLIAIVATHWLAGTTDFQAGGIFPGAIGATTLGILLFLYAYGIGKAALMPLHRWLPAAMVAPTPVSAFLHAVAVVKAGVFSIMKVVVYIFGIDRIADLPAQQWLTWIAAATILIASLIALRQDNLKRRLAYSTVSQLSYVVLGAMLATQAGVFGGTLHIAMHAFAKITLFFCAGAIMITTHRTEVSQLDGLGRAMPITMTAFLLASLSLVGLPPGGGLWSKWYLALGTIEAGDLLLLAVLLISSLLNLSYLMVIPLRAFLRRPAGEHGIAIREAPWPAATALSLTALLSIAMFFVPGPAADLAQQTAIAAR